MWRKILGAVHTKALIYSRRCAYPVVGILVTYFVTDNFFSILPTSGDSMYPTIADGGFIVYDKRQRSLEHIKRGDVIVCRDSYNPGELICKRVAALEGDRIAYKTPLLANYRYTDLSRIPLGHMWLLGDNKESSLDSRTYGPVPVALTLGIVVYQIFPPKSIEGPL